MSEIEKLRDHQLLRVLQYAVSKSRFTGREIIAACNIAENDFFRFRNVNVFVRTAGQSESDLDNTKWTLSPEAFISYLQYVELREAEKSARSAKRLAITAIVISALLALASIVLQLYQASTTIRVKLDETQMKILEKQVEIEKVAIGKVDSVLQYQKRILISIEGLKSVTPKKK